MSCLPSESAPCSFGIHTYCTFIYYIFTLSLLTTAHIALCSDEVPPHIMPTDRQRRGREHEKRGSLAGWAWNLVSLKKKTKNTTSESGRNGAEGDRNCGKRGGRRQNMSFRWLRRKPERSIWSSLGLDGWIQRNALARDGTKIWTCLVFLAARVGTVNSAHVEFKQQNVRIQQTYGIKKAKLSGFSCCLFFSPSLSFLFISPHLSMC